MQIYFLCYLRISELILYKYKLFNILSFCNLCTKLFIYKIVSSIWRLKTDFTIFSTTIFRTFRICLRQIRSAYQICVYGKYRVIRSGRMHITFRSSVTRSGKSGSGHSKPIIIDSCTPVARPTIESIGMFRHVREIWFLHAPPVDKKDITSVMRDTRGWKLKRLPPFLSSLLTNILYSADTFVLRPVRGKDFFQLVETGGSSACP